MQSDGKREVINRTTNKYTVFAHWKGRERSSDGKKPGEVGGGCVWEVWGVPVFRVETSLGVASGGVRGGVCSVQSAELETVVPG